MKKQACSIAILCVCGLLAGGIKAPTGQMSHSSISANTDAEGDNVEEKIPSRRWKFQASHFRLQRRKIGVLGVSGLNELVFTSGRIWAATRREALQELCKLHPGVPIRINQLELHVENSPPDFISEIRLGPS